MRKISILFVFIFIAFAGNSRAFAFDKCDQDCQKCHTLDKDQAAETLKKLIPDVKILEVQQGPIKGLWEVGMESGGKKGILYVDYSKKKIIAGNIFEIETKKNFTQESFQKINKVDFSSIPLENSIVMGNKDAKYKIVVFDDPD
jgi:thiol:disulfide interchange protein DsbC